MAKKTVLYPIHEKLGAKLIPFAGYDMPVRYTGDKAEHVAPAQSQGQTQADNRHEDRKTEILQAQKHHRTTANVLRDMNAIAIFTFGMTNNQGIKQGGRGHPGDSDQGQQYQQSSTPVQCATLGSILGNPPGRR